VTSVGINLTYYQSFTGENVSEGGGALALELLVQETNSLHFPSQRWYAVHTRSKYEKTVRAELTAKGVANFLPSVHEIHQWKDREKVVERPIFPGYIFVRITDRPAEIIPILRTEGTVRILGGGRDIEPVPDSEIEAIQRLVDAKMPFLPHPCLHEGDRVKVKSGPLRDVEGTLVRVNQHQGRLVLAIEMLSRAVAVEVDLRDIEVLRPPSFYRTRMTA
jgi:transcription antitermination factor NusG